MKRQLLDILSAIVLLLLLCSGALADIGDFFAWLFTLRYSQPDTSIAGGIIVRLLTFFVSYGLVGIIFNSLGCFSSKIMSIVYFIISTLLGFVLAYVVWTIEQYILVIGKVLGVIAILIIALFVEKLIINKKADKTAVFEEE